MCALYAIQTRWTALYRAEELVRESEGGTRTHFTEFTEPVGRQGQTLCAGADREDPNDLFH